MDDQPIRLYLDLLKKALAYTLWPEPPHPVDEYIQFRLPLKQKIVAWLYRLLSALDRDIRVVRDIKVAPEARAEGRFWPAYADTMIGLKRLDNLQACVETVIKEKIEGDLIETGVWRGGACIFMRGILAAYGVTDRTVFVADSFQGLPEPDSAEHPLDKEDNLHSVEYLKVSKAAVMNNFRRYGLLDDQVAFIAGWFKDTLNDPRLKKLALIRLDGDMYGSTIEALDALYPKLSRGGFCIIDDYGALEPCRRAVDDYRSARGITAELIKIDWTGCYWRKE